MKVANYHPIDPGMPPELLKRLPLRERCKFATKLNTDFINWCKRLALEPQGFRLADVLVSSSQTDCFEHLGLVPKTGLYHGGPDFFGIIEKQNALKLFQAVRDNVFLISQFKGYIGSLQDWMFVRFVPWPVWEKQVGADLEFFITGKFLKANRSCFNVLKKRFPELEKKPEKKVVRPRHKQKIKKDPQRNNWRYERGLYADALRNGWNNGPEAFVDNVLIAKHGGTYGKKRRNLLIGTLYKVVISK